MLVCVSAAADLKALRADARAAKIQAQQYAQFGDDRYLKEAAAFARAAQTSFVPPADGLRGLSEIQLKTALASASALGDAMLWLYAVSGDRSYLALSEKAAAVIVEYLPAPAQDRSTESGQPVLDVEAAKYLNLLARYTGRDLYRETAERVLRAITHSPSLPAASVEAQCSAAHAQLHCEPLHVTVVGHKDDPAAAALFRQALRYPSNYKRTEWWDKREGPMPNPDVAYPDLGRAAAFVCTNHRCSLPIFVPEKLPEVIKKLSEGAHQ